MKHELRLTDIGEGLDEAEIVSWLVNVGDRVTRDQPLIEVMTDKSNAELPAPSEGVVTDLNGNVGDIITVGHLLAVIDDVGADHNPQPARSDDADSGNEKPLAATPPPPAPEPTAAESSPAPAPAVDIATPAPLRIKASPATRRAAAERGVDLARVQGSGPGGRILLSDLEQPVPEQPAPEPIVPAPAPQTASLAPPEPATDSSIRDAQVPDPSPRADAGLDTTTPVQPPLGTPDAPTGTVPLRGMRRAIAQNMARSWFDIPHIHCFDHIDAEPMLEVRARLKASGREAYESLTPLSFFVGAVASALKAHPQANASINMSDETITYHGAVNVGVAVAAPQGLVVPVLRGADQLEFATLCVALGQLVRGAREGSLSREHFQDGTVTITNFGSLGGEQATPLIRPPEALIVGFGSVAARPYVIDDEVVARKTMHLVAGADHRLLDGDITTSILSHISSIMLDPLKLVV